MSSDGSMRNVGWPNSVCPGIGAFRIDVPAEWSAIEPPAGLIAFLAPPIDNFRVNLVVFGERVPAGKELGALAEEALRGAGATDIVAIGIDGGESDEHLPSAVRRADLLLPPVGGELCAMMSCSRASHSGDSGALARGGKNLTR